MFNAAKNVSSFAAEAVPVVGVAVITAVTLSDLYDDCQTLKDLNELNREFGHDVDDEQTVCGIMLPDPCAITTKGELFLFLQRLTQIGCNSYSKKDANFV